MFAKDNVERRSNEAPVIKKKASFGPFKFKNFFQSSKGKDAGGSGNGISKYREQLAVLAPSKRVNQPSQLHSGTGSLPNRYDQRAPYQSHSQSLPRPVPRPPPICTSFPQGDGFSSPYAPTSTCDSSPNVLPYMAGAGDGWDTPFLPYPPAASRSRHANYNTEFPFPVVPSHQVEDDPMEQLVVQDDNARKGRVTSAAFEYQEFETDVRNSGQLDSSVSSNEYKEGTVTDDLARSTNSHTQSLRKSPLGGQCRNHPTNEQTMRIPRPPAFAPATKQTNDAPRTSSRDRQTAIYRSKLPSFSINRFRGCVFDLGYGAFNATAAVGYPSTRLL
ncbi:hypothetical protein QFC22_004261 [Naganishia vaughanmartiniae]|uniref:Uncharacterized protein n=1 Tax=Naganishia vaughanmartiniae TaxID=1424756 RepID=A0ACC2X2R8_9TREE|nr:hypothetical protein QFC22_004261 [Naganishia vaughanmartiniae]